MQNEFLAASPLIAIGILAVLGIVFDAMREGNQKLTYNFSIITLILTAGLAAYTLTIPQDSLLEINRFESLSRGTLYFGGYSAILDIVFCIAGLLTIIASRDYIARMGLESNEFYHLIVYAVAGMMIMAHSAHLLNMFIGIETMSLSFYILAGYFRTNSKSVEAAMKYFLLGAFATGFLLYGMAMIYGSTGVMHFEDIRSAISAGAANDSFYLFGIGLLIVGLTFKVAGFPFHQWAPDVYTGAPTVVTAFMSVAGKAAALIAFVIVGRALLPTEIVNESLKFASEKAILVIAFISAATMLVGNISALVQVNVKRMLAYSSVAHAGYLLMGIVANNESGWSGVIFYSAAYMFMQLGAFIVVSVFEDKNSENQNINDYAGLYKSHPMLAAAMAIFMLSLAGIPPMAGFFGKYMLFKGAIQNGYTWLTIVAVISSIISMYFYIGLIVQMYFKERSEGQMTAYMSGAKITIAISVVGAFLLGFFPSLLHDLILASF